jgi:hypothetical protein
MNRHGGGWTLVGITNSEVTVSADYAAAATDPAVGSYSKPLKGASGTESPYECGSTGAGVLGYQRNTGSWTWSGTHISASLGSLHSDNIVWPIDLPGYDSSDSACHPWGNCISGVHYENFASKGWADIDGTSGRGFSCNPQSNAYGVGYGTWASASGTKFVRYWLK